MPQSSLFQLSEWWIIALFLAGMMLATEVGYRLGGRLRASYSDACRGYVSGILGGTIGLLGLVLGFTFSMAVSRFDAAKVHIVSEANAVGTAFLRSQTLTGDDRVTAGKLFEEYVSTLNKMYMVSSDPASFERINTDLSKAQTKLWRQAIEVSSRHPDMVPTGIYVQALNEMFDAAGRRLAFTEYHIPEMVFVLLALMTLLTFGLAGFGSGVADSRRLVASFVLAVMVTLVILTIIDLERPKRGLIQVTHTRIEELRGLLLEYGYGKSPPL